VRVREASVDDAAAIARVQVASWRDAFRGLLPADYLEQLDEAERAGYWADKLTGLGERETVLVAEEDGEVVAFAHAGPADEPEHGELYAMHVWPALRRRGIGFDLHDAALRRLRAAGVRSVHLWLLKGNELARRFYERQGWVDDGAEREGMPPSGALEVRYARPL
jgi:GNAT superfamily N-acetyltransferase